MLSQRIGSGTGEDRRITIATMRDSGPERRANSDGWMERDISLNELSTHDRAGLQGVVVPKVRGETICMSGDLDMASASCPLAAEPARWQSEGVCCDKQQA